jgi:hypothetical protein
LAYQLEGERVLADWLAREQRRDVQDRVIEWITFLIQDPSAVDSVRLPGRRPDRVALVPDVDVAVTYLVAEEYRTIRLLEVRSLQG